ncbi:MAG: hypothetical protein ACODAD_01235 [Planctomycetota bacterium]
MSWCSSIYLLLDVCIGPFPARQSVDQLEIHHGVKAFDVVHGVSCLAGQVSCLPTF